MIHETAIVDEGAVVGPGTKIWHWTHIQHTARIGPECNIGQNCYIAGVVGSNCKIQNNVSVYKGVVLEQGVFVGPSAVFTNTKNPRAMIEQKEYVRTLVKRGATIGANATIVCGVTIGIGAMVGAGAVVTKDVPPGQVWVGNPAQRIGSDKHLETCYRVHERIDHDLNKMDKSMMVLAERVGFNGGKAVKLEKDLEDMHTEFVTHLEADKPPFCTKDCTLIPKQQELTCLKCEFIDCDDEEPPCDKCEQWNGFTPKKASKYQVGVEPSKLTATEVAAAIERKENICGKCGCTFAILKSGEKICACTPKEMVAEMGPEDTPILSGALEEHTCGECDSYSAGTCHAKAFTKSGVVLSHYKAGDCFTPKKANYPWGSVPKSIVAAKLSKALEREDEPEYCCESLGTRVGDTILRIDGTDKFLPRWIFQNRYNLPTTMLYCPFCGKELK